MSSTDRSKADRLRREIATLRDKIARESKKEAEALARESKARSQAASSRSDATAKMKLREADRERNKAVQAQKKRADFESSIACKSSELAKVEGKIGDQQARAMRDLEQETRRRAVASKTDVLRGLDRVAAEAPARPRESAYDFFVSHASPDRDEVARPLAKLLIARGCKVWIDEQEIRIGDSIRQKIDEGLALSAYGIVVLSKSFLAGRTWTERELNGLFVQEEQAGEPRILPLWHDVTKEEVARYSPILADKHALKTADYTLEEIAGLLVTRLKPQ